MHTRDCHKSGLLEPPKYTSCMHRYAPLTTRLKDTDTMARSLSVTGCGIKVTLHARVYVDEENYAVWVGVAIREHGRVYSVHAHTQHPPCATTPIPIALISPMRWPQREPPKGCSCGRCMGLSSPCPPCHDEDVRCLLPQCPGLHTGRRERRKARWRQHPCRQHLARSATGARCSRPREPCLRLGPWLVRCAMCSLLIMTRHLKVTCVSHVHTLHIRMHVLLELVG